MLYCRVETPRPPLLRDALVGQVQSDLDGLLETIAVTRGGASDPEQGGTISEEYSIERLPGEADLYFGSRLVA
ncbi:MAG: hypothetical protein D6795_20660, partial [Deltaproteobacteria bacterium]